MNKLFGLIIIGIFLITLGSAYDSHQQNIDYNYLTSVANSDSCVLGGINYPDGTSTNLNITMNKEDYLFSTTITSGNFSQLGTTCFDIVCSDADADPQYESGTKCLEITPNGKTLSIGESFLQFGTLAILIGLFILILFIIPKLPNQDNYEEGVLISVNQLKYLRPVLYFVDWFILTAIVFVGANLSLSFSSSQLIGKILFKMFYILLALSLPLVFFWFIKIFHDIFQDNEMKGYIERGIETGR